MRFGVGPGRMTIGQRWRAWLRTRPDEAGRPSRVYLSRAEDGGYDVLLPNGFKRPG